MVLYSKNQCLQWQSTWFRGITPPTAYPQLNSLCIALFKIKTMSKQEEMYHMVMEYQNSRLSAKEFSKERGVCPSTFNYWVQKKEQEDHPGGFVKMDTASSSSNNPLELIYPNGVWLQMNSSDLPLITRLLKLY